MASGCMHESACSQIHALTTYARLLSLMHLIILTASFNKVPQYVKLHSISMSTRSTDEQEACEMRQPQHHCADH